MLFNSYTFVIFLFVVLIIYYRLRSWSVRKAFLLLASYLFYAAWNPPFVILLWISTVADWFLAKAIAASPQPRRRKVYLGLSLLVNLGLLTYFKYGGFLVENIVGLLQAVGVKVELATPSIVLPVGISFYTFQTLSYSLDVYFGKTRPWHSFLDYALYVTFFPQLVAGPIVRAVDYLPQCIEPKKLTGSRLAWGASLIVLGLFEKAVVADGLLAPISEAVYDNPATPTFLCAWCGTLAFAGQIFCDFAGYSTCAIGVALCLGFNLPDNFKFPYAAVGFSDFWKRWHISLSSWLRDYLYIPLGGNRRGPYRTHGNLMVTMLLGGLWHGASWTFVIWGGLHGLFLMVERVVKQIRPVRALAKKIPPILLAGVTFLLVCIAWVFFRAHTLEKAHDVLAAMMGFQNQGTSSLRDYEIAKSVGVIGLILATHWMNRDVSLEQLAAKIPWWLCSAALACMLIAIATLSGEDRAFIYFQF